jgi:hypothetical protein
LNERNKDKTGSQINPVEYEAGKQSKIKPVNKLLCMHRIFTEHKDGSRYRNIEDGE